jgi:hypothetical protein
MKPLWILVGLIAALLVALFATLLNRPAAPKTVGAPAAAAEVGEDIADLKRTVALLAHRLDELEHAHPLDLGAERRDALLPPSLGNAQSGDGPRDASWYLEQYVLSFADSPQGSEYFRLAVDAYSIELRAPICELVRDAGRVDELRASLATMLGKRRFQGDMDVVDALIVAVRPPSADPLALRALQSLEIAGESRAQTALENVLFSLKSKPVQERALAVIRKLAGERGNSALLRLFLRAPDDEWRALLVRMLDSSELAAALDLLRNASTQQQPVRLAGAYKIGEYIEDEFQDFVVDWLNVETDAQVIEALHVAQKQQKDMPGWHAMKATGAPDADPKRDDPNAWASASGDMGIQWLELTYATPMRASGVRIYEVNSPGAVAEVKAKGPNGEWDTLWSGTASGNGAPLVLEWPLTSYEVKTIRLVLDTNRTPGWNEIDAVELIGGGAQWAKQATASSTYNGGRREINLGTAGSSSLDQLLFNRGLQR